MAAAKAAAARVADCFFIAPSSFSSFFFDDADMTTVAARRAGRRVRALACTGARRATGRAEAVILAAEGARSVCMRSGKEGAREERKDTRAWKSNYPLIGREKL